MVNSDQKTAHIVFCVALFAVALAFRVTGADFGLINYDERINDSARFLTGELIPSQHFYPPFFNYLIGVAFVGLAAFGLLTDMWSNAGEFRQAYFADATPFYLTARYLTACIGALAAPLAYACSRQVGLTPVSSFLVGAFSALLPLSVYMSHIAKGDTGLAVASLAVVFAFLRRVGIGPSLRWDLALGLAASLALSFKHSAVLVLAPMALAMIIVLARREGVWASLKSFGVSLLVILVSWPIFNVGVLLDFTRFVEFQQVQAVMSVREEEGFGAGLPMTVSLLGDVMFGLNPLMLVFAIMAPLWLWSHSCQLKLKDAVAGVWVGLMVATVCISLVVGTRQPPHLFQANVTIFAVLGAIILLDMIRAYVGWARGVVVTCAVAGIALMTVSSISVVNQAVATPVSQDVANLLQEKFADRKIQTSYELPVPRTIEAQRVQLDRWEGLAQKYNVTMPAFSEERKIKEDVEGALFWVPAPFVMYGLEADDVENSEFPVQPHAWPLQPDEWVLDTWLEDGYDIFVVNGLDRMIDGLRSSHMISFYQGIEDRCEVVAYFDVRKPLFDEYDVTVFDCSMPITTG